MKYTHEYSITVDLGRGKKERKKQLEKKKLASYIQAILGRNDPVT
jgi:hypothetical protein